MIGKVAAFAAVGMLLAGQAHAGDAALAQVNAVKGSVVVSQNGKLVSAASTTGLRAGDRIVAKDGQASVKFSDGCEVTLKPQAMLTVGSASPCASGPGLVSANQGSSAQMGTGMKFWLTFLGGAAVVALIASTSDDDPESSSSP